MKFERYPLKNRSLFPVFGSSLAEECGLAGLTEKQSRYSYKQIGLLTFALFGNRYKIIIQLTMLFSWNRMLE